MADQPTHFGGSIIFRAERLALGDTLIAIAADPALSMLTRPERVLFIAHLGALLAREGSPTIEEQMRREGYTDTRTLELGARLLDDAAAELRAQIKHQTRRN